MIGKETSFWSEKAKGSFRESKINEGSQERQIANCIGLGLFI